MYFFPPSLDSEEAKSTTWLHPVSGEAVITGHRKTPGKHVTPAVRSSFCCLRCVSRPASCIVVSFTKKPDSSHADIHAVFLNA